MGRKDATRIKFEEPFHSIVPYIMPRRVEAEVYLSQEFDITKLNKFIKKYNKKNGTNLKFFHCFCYAAGRTIKHREQLNYFVKGKRFWKRNDICLSFVARQQFKDEAEEKLMFMKVKDNDTVESISKQILGDVDKVRKTNSNDLDEMMHVLGKLPRWLMSIIIWVTQTMDYFGCMPSSLQAGDPNYATAIIANLGSIKSNSCYHHLSNYGTCSIVMTIGTMKSIDGKDTVEIGFTADERIADGFYFAKSLRHIDYLFQNPESLLEEVAKNLPEGIC